MRKTDHIDIEMIDLENIRQILVYRNYFENNTNSFYSVAKGNPSQPYTYKKEVLEFIKALYHNNVMQPFNWVSWRDSPEAQNFLSNPNRIKGAPMEVLVKLLIHFVRADRFISGYLVSAIDDGFILAILERLDDLTANDSFVAQEVSPVSH